jgi:hypothetical protein
LRRWVNRDAEALRRPEGNQVLSAAEVFEVEGSATL